MALIVLQLILYAACGTVLYCSQPKRNCHHFILGATLGIATGLGISSSLFFVFLATGLPFYLQSWIEVLTCVAILFFNLQKKEFFAAGFRFTLLPINELWKKKRLASLCFLVIFFIIVVYCFVIELHKPHGDWDAYAIWNTQARLIYRGGIHWTNLFHGGYSHPDYPLLLAGLVARWWFLLGHETVYIPMAISLLTLALILLVLFHSLSLFKNSFLALIAIMITTSTRFFLDHVGSQYPDILLSLFFLCSCIFLSQSEEQENPKEKNLIMVGLFGGFAVWTKNEGALFLLAVFFSQAFHSTRDLVKRIVYLAIGTLPMIIIVVYFKIKFAPPSDLFNAESSSIVEKLRDIDRYYYVADRFKEMIFSFGNGILSPFIMLLVFILISGRETKERKSHRVILFISLMVLCGYFMIYIITPHDLKWHIDTSLDRLLVQLLPTMIFGIFLYVKEP